MEYWWKSANLYQIWPKSFNDSNNDGVGDINGIVEKLDYIKQNGFDAIWISPFYKSPMVDNGYDVEDYYNVNEIFGSNDDFDKLIKECKQKGLKVLIDIVVNHTSDKHMFFQESKKSKDNYYSDFYIWRDEIPKETLQRTSIPIWTYVEERKQYYLHLFDKTQPDLNWDNPNVIKECANILKYWLEKGVSGFRFDVIELIGKDVDKNLFENGPSLHKNIAQLLRQANVDKEILTVGECWRTNEEIALQYTKPDSQELSMIFSFKHVSLTKKKIKKDWSEYNRPTADQLYESFVKYNFSIIQKGGWLSNVFENHDLPRSVSLYGSEKYSQNSAKTIALLQYVVPGTPCIYQGQEIGLKNFYSEDLNDFEDVDLFRKKQKLVDEEKFLSMNEFLNTINKLGRDNARRPMQWNNDVNMGFTKGKPWIRACTNQREINVENQLKDENSVLIFFKKLNGLRKSEYKDLFIASQLKTNNVTESLTDFSIYNEDKKIRYVGNWSDEPIEVIVKKDNKVIISFKQIELKESIVLQPWESILLEENKEN
ncbi:glucan 1,6-alpha-glucosidase [Spiroplasma helicoides]|uniref:Glucan 1,6-alpha-glucosidase n=1 Tax=Spiroplasma helicoides TaxID=216938 RepID=A0A1B3SLS5_9MOLU|nr:alpha-glucosidase [Spiroplasma helicoides]AOG60882.1 glucan 1,6-alpha-glucosidase [Spiroplasma helicoides]